MKRAQIINDYYVVLTDKEFEHRMTTDSTYVEAYLENGIICLIPIKNWETIKEFKYKK